MQEFDTPMPEDPGGSQNRETGPVSREEIEEKFEKFINVDGGTNPLIEIKIIDREKLFDVTEVKPSSDLPPTILRRYWGYQPGEQDLFPFSINANAIISDDGKRLSLSKTGRPSTTEIGGRSEFERINLEKTEKGYTLSYALGNIKGEELKAQGQIVPGDYSVVMCGYSESGGLDYIEPLHRDMERDSGKPSIYDTRGGIFRDIESFKEFARTNGEINEESYKLKVRFIENARYYSKTNERVGIFEIIMFDKSGNPEYKLVVPEKVDIDGISAELGAEQLLKDPYQPSEGVPGKSIGDIDWKNKSFPDITGIKLTPIDTSDSLPGPK